MLLVAVASALLLQLAAVYLPPLRDLLGTQPVAVTDLLIVGAAASLGYAAIRLDRLIRPRATSAGGVRATGQSQK